MRSEQFKWATDAPVVHIFGENATSVSEPGKKPVATPKPVQQPAAQTTKPVLPELPKAVQAPGSTATTAATPKPVQKAVTKEEKPALKTPRVIQKSEPVLEELVWKHDGKTDIKPTPLPLYKEPGEVKPAVKITPLKTQTPGSMTQPRAVQAPGSAATTAATPKPVQQTAATKPLSRGIMKPTLAPELAGEQPAEKPAVQATKPLQRGIVKPILAPELVERTPEQKVVNWIADWENRNNIFLENYNARFGSRKGDYTDAYVGDAQDYLDTVIKETQFFESEKERILDILTQNSSTLDPELVASVMKTLNDGTAEYEKIRQTAQKEATYWAQFENEEDYKAQQDAVMVYNEMLSKDLKQLELGIDWVESRTEKVTKLIDKYLLINGKPYYKGKQDQMDALMQQIIENSAGWATVSHAAIITGQVKKDMEAALQNARDYYEEAKWQQGYKGYMDNMAAEDFAKNSQYVSTRTGVKMEDAAYTVNNANTALVPDAAIYVTGHTEYQEDKLFKDFLYDYINGHKDALLVAETNNDIFDLYDPIADKSFYQTMTKEEIGVYNYLYKTQGKEKAEAFLTFIANDLQSRRRAQEQEQWAEYANEHPGAASVLSVAMSPLKGFTYVGQAADMLLEGEINENAGYNKFSYIPSTIRSEVSHKIEESGNWGAVGSFAYNTGMSMADYLFTTAVSGGNQALALAIMGTGAAADATLAAKDRGLSDNEAFALGTIAGIVEVVMEKISFSAWLDGDISDGTFRYMMKNAIAGGSEEVGTNLINTIADIIIAGDKSQWNMAIQKYIDQGKTPEEAYGLAVADKAKELGLDFLGGTVSGTMISGGTKLAADSSKIGNGASRVAEPGRFRMTGWDGRVAVTEATGKNIKMDGVTYKFLGYDENGSPVYQDVEVLKEQVEDQDVATQPKNEQKSVENTENHDTIKLPDIQIGRSLGAKAKNYQIMDLSTGEMFNLVEGTNLQNVEVFAGKGVKTPYHNAHKYAYAYGGKIEDWQHVKGNGWIAYTDGDRYAEIHWSQCEGIGKHDLFIKRWKDES